MRSNRYVSFEVRKRAEVMIIHYHCPSRKGPGMFIRTGKRSRPEVTQDKTEVYKCDCCKATVGVERYNPYMPGQISVYL